MKCAKCGEEIPPKEQEFSEAIIGERIPLPCRACSAELKRQWKGLSDEYNRITRGKVEQKKAKGETR
jgi:hypothetical protein